MLNTAATEIVMTDGSTTGIVSTSTDGSTVTINAPIVVVCAGGYGASKGIDEFGRFYFADDATIIDGPHYASPMTWATLCTFDGIAIDENRQAVDADGNAIEGLYACGEITCEPFLYCTGDGMTLAERLTA